MGRNYHEPPYLRWSFGAFIQAARSVTWMLRSEKSGFNDFESWYAPWQQRASENPKLRWLNETRVTLTKRAALAPRSWARFRCLFEQVDPSYCPDEEEDLYIHLNPFVCTHAYIRYGPVEKHGHEYERSWEVDDMPGRELLELCADIYDLLGEVVQIAHVEAGAGMGTVKRDNESGGLWSVPRVRHELPCMDKTEYYRTVRTYVRDGQEVWDDAPEHV